MPSRRIVLLTVLLLLLCNHQCREICNNCGTLALFIWRWYARGFTVYDSDPLHRGSFTFPSNALRQFVTPIDALGWNAFIRPRFFVPLLENYQMKMRATTSCYRNVSINDVAPKSLVSRRQTTGAEESITCLVICIDPHTCRAIHFTCTVLQHPLATNPPPPRPISFDTFQDSRFNIYLFDP